MRPRALIAVAAAACAAVPLAGPAPAAGGEAPARADGASTARLSAFGSCGSLVRYARRHALRAGAPSPGIPPPRTAPPGGGGGGGGEGGRGAPVGGPVQDDSPGTGTNVQEAGVDEPDLVKTDGRTIYVATYDRVFAVDVTGGEPRLRGSLSLQAGIGHELLLAGDRLLVLSGGGGAYAARRARSASSYAGGDGVARIAEVDVSDPGRMRVLRTLAVPGHHVGARLVGRTARVVVSSSPRVHGRAAIRRSRVGDWRPAYVLRDRRSGRRARHALVRCRDVRRARAFSGLDLLSVLTIDTERGLPAVDADAVMTGGETVYASRETLYVGTEREVDPDAERPGRAATAIHAFDASRPGATEYRGSGRVPGWLLNQFSLSEHEGRLRVATTEQPPWFDGEAESESFVTVLEQRAGGLAEVGRVGGLGRGERIYAVRFIGDAGYVVTFRETDPLYAIDLSDPARPRVRGELKILGYSAYLHPIGGDLLIGIGQDATEDGRTLGTQLSLFDVSDLDAPRRLHAHSLGGDSASEAEYDHHAFLWWAPGQLAVLPLVEYPEGESDDPFSGAVGFRVDGASGIAEAGRVSHPEGVPVRRSLVVGDRLYTASEAGVLARTLDGLAGAGWAPFPTSPPPAGDAGPPEIR